MTDRRPPVRILVLCTGNSCRSQMAEGFIRAYANGRVDVSSAGTSPQGVSRRAIAVMKEIGIDISGHRSQHVNEFAHREFDFVITVCDNAAVNCPVFPGGGMRLHWPFDDPAQASGSDEEIINVFRRVRDLIGARTREWLASQQLLVTL